jgi:hypothetical protein
MTNELVPPSRFADLQTKERPRLHLAPRSIPTWDELEARHVTQEAWHAMTVERREEIVRALEEDEDRARAAATREQEREAARAQKSKDKARKKEARGAKQRALLASAFASSDEDAGCSSDSDWFENDLEFDGSDDEGL